MNEKAGKKSKWSWLQFLVSGPVAFGLTYGVLSSDPDPNSLWIALGVGVTVGLLAGRFGADAWHLLGDLGSSV